MLDSQLCILILQNLNESDETFIKEVFSGCVRYSNIMNVVLNGYFARDGKMILRSSQNVYVGK